MINANDTPTPAPVETYLRELAGTVPADSKRTVVLRLARPVECGGLGLSAATLYRYIADNDAGEHARTILDALDRRRRLAGQDVTTIADFRALTAGRGGVA